MIDTGKLFVGQQRYVMICKLYVINELELHYG